MANLHWADALPEMGTGFRARAQDVAARKERLRQELASTLQAEADLFMDIYRSGQWTPHEMARAMVEGMEPATIAYLPDEFPR